MRKLFSTLIILFAMSFSVQAMDLQEAKQAGFVGEQTNGYLGVIKVSDEVNALVNSVNSKRQAKYQELATKHNLTVDAISARAGKKAQLLTESGQYIQSPSGGWVKK